MKSKTVVTALLLLALGCGGSGVSSTQSSDMAQGGRSGAQTGASSGLTGTSTNEARASGGQVGTTSTVPARASGGQAGTSNTPAITSGGHATSSSAQGGTSSASGGLTSVIGSSGGSEPATGAAGSGGQGGTSAQGGTSGNTGGRVGSTGGQSTGGASGGRTSSGGMGGAISGFVASWDFESMTDNKVPEASGRDLPITVDKGKLADGPTGKNLSFATNQASATTSTPIVDATSGFSISIWVKLDKLDAYNTFVAQDGQTISSFYLQKRDNNYFAFTTFPSDSTSATACVAQSTMKPRVGEWYHLVGTRNPTSGDQRLYVDGMLMGKANCTGGFKASGPLVIGRGRWDGPVDWMTGAVDDLAVADRVLKADEVVDLYQRGRPEARHYLFAYFAEGAQARGDGLRLAHSHDALHWGAIGGGKIFMPPTVGGKSFRDPHVMRDPTGTYHLVWTTSCVPWGESGCVQDRGFGHATSKDMATFGQAQYITVALNAEHVWAPETIWDPASQQFMVFWSTPIDSNPAASDPHSIYYLLTKDFLTFSEPKVLYGKSGRNFIDATIIKQGDSYLMFLKDEADGQKNLRAVSSTVLFGTSAWTGDPSAPLTGNYAAEGPSPLLIDGQMLLFFDKFAEGTYGALRSRSLDALTTPTTWSDISTSVFFAGVRHGTPIEVPFDTFRAVALKAAE